MAEHKALRIVELRTENVKRIKAVRVVPDPERGLVVITGRNGAGKTSVLDALWFALAGKAAQKDTPNPIRTGADEAYVTVDLGDYSVTRTWKGDKSELTVTAADGAEYGSPQRFLDKRLGDLTFDPLDFTMSSGKVQRDRLLGLVELPFDPDELEARRQGLYDKRTEVGRELKAVEGQLAGMKVPDPALPMASVSVAALAETLAEAQDATREYAQAEARVTQAEAAVKVAQDALTEARIALGLAPAPSTEANIESLRRQMATAEQVNEAVRERDAREAAITRRDEHAAEQVKLTEAITMLDTVKAEVLAAVTMPVDGLGFDAEGVTFNGQPFSQASAAEQLRVSMAIGMASDPEIRIMRITDGSLLDGENMAVIEQMATEHDFQCWVERVDDETGAMSVVIEDGEVAGAEAWPAPELRSTEPEATTTCSYSEPHTDGSTSVCTRPAHRADEPHAMQRVER